MSTRLEPPVGEGDHTSGPDDAPVTLVEYGDFECPHCGRAYPIVEAIRDRLGARLRFVYRHFPLSQVHPNATNAAEMSEIAATEGRFWEMHRLLFEHQDALEPADLLRYAVQVGLDRRRAAKELGEHAFAGHVQESFMSGVRSGVNGTPTFFINGVRYDGSWELPDLLDALRTAGRLQEA